ncbi:hydroxymethylpyrimidine/phosphomethylpyrimidine kinase [Aquimarina sp. 2201CG14-23]|uniref:hydroxymethylpyrimidine/phosphomethylpyrimidine kinase n=1 Tax=Aquimarina mycalae TaxID=3040073 RepID=UPI002477D49E|nr:hydroxymethylpyrimidine/phosphomethylpyrimidine kinase [Aquimarina sp. 2201CG14-23]MDH7446056.1 hydroxymethylpyrimidine/phosphomethylpyrimidine kinase [Aquimarina sp. 2201CG14-23]
MQHRPNVLTIAGFDPSSGAGLTADIKTFEALKCYGFAVCTANTIQNDTDFEACHWIDVKLIKDQIRVLFKKFTIDYVKIGIIKDWKVLEEIIDFLITQNSTIRIILDPILKSSSNFDFHNSKEDEATFDQVLSKIYLLTPNYEEIQRLYSGKNIEETITHISNKTNLFLKGGHCKEAIGKDVLFTSKHKKFTLNPKLKEIYEKHGSGCVLSSSITAQLALGFPILKACNRAKRYTEKVLSSNKTLLGYHKM